MIGASFQASGSGVGEAGAIVVVGSDVAIGVAGLWREASGDPVGVRVAAGVGLGCSLLRVGRGAAVLAQALSISARFRLHSRSPGRIQGAPRWDARNALGSRSWNPQARIATGGFGPGFQCFDMGKSLPPHNRHVDPQALKFIGDY